VRYPVAGERELRVVTNFLDPAAFLNRQAGVFQHGKLSAIAAMPGHDARVENGQSQLIKIEVISAKQIVLIAR